MENFNQYCLPENEFIDFSYKPINELTIYIKKLDKCFKKDSDNFAEICFLVFQIHNLFMKNSYGIYLKKNQNMTYSFDTIMSGFGISKSESSRLLSCYDKFITKKTDKPMILSEFYGFSKSKLFELLQIENKQIVLDLQNKVLRFDFTIKQIRDYVKNLQALKKQQAKLNGNTEEETKEEFIEEDIPMAYNPQQHYDFDYFQEKNKAQLLNIVWELQKEYEKLKTSYNKIKKEKKQNG